MAKNDKFESCMKKILVIVAACFCHAIVSAQIYYGNIRFRQLGYSDGLPHNTVNAITQDKDGFLWFGTRNGLCRYDGYTLKDFYHDETDSTSLCHDFILKLCSDEVNGKIWITTDGGLCAWCHDTGKFRTYRIPGNRKNDVKVTLTSSGELLAGCSNGIFRYDSASDTFTPYLLHGKNYVKTIIEDDNGDLWIECGNMIIWHDRDKDMNVPVPKPLRKYRQDSDNFTWLGDGRIMMNSGDGLLIFRTTDFSLARLSKKTGIDSYICASTDVTGNIWIGTENGIYIIDGKTFDVLAHYEQGPYDTSMLNDSPIYNIFRDNCDNIWIGTYFGGINYYIYGSEQFHLYTYGSTSRHISGKAVRQITGTPDGGILLATEDGGLNYIDKDENITRAETIHRKLGIEAKNIHSVEISSDGSLLVGLFLKGLVKYDPVTGKTTDFGKIAEKGSSGFCIHETEDGRIYYGGPSGLFAVSDKEKPAVRKICHLSSFCFLPREDGTVLIGTRKNGICLLDTENDRTDTLSIPPLDNLFITYLYRGHDGNIYVGTNNNGLFVLDSDLRIKRTYTKAEIFSNGIKGIIEDKKENLWVGTDNGLINIDSSTGNIFRYTVTDGLPANQLNYASAYMDSSGQVYFGTIDGLVSFYPSKIRSREQKFNVAVTDILCSSSGNEPQDETAKAIQSEGKLVLTHPQAKSIRIEYSGMNYKYMQNTRYAMFMEGIDKEWQLVGNQHQVRFSNLSAGDYVLKIMAGHDGINWDESGMETLEIKVLPPWWLSWWSCIIYVAIAATVIWSAYKYAKARLILRMKLKAEHEQRLNVEKMNRQKTAFFTYVSHDLKTPLTLILSPLKNLMMQESLTEKDKGKIETVYRNAARMNYLIDELLTFSKIEMSQMRLSVRKGNIMSFMKGISEIFDEVSKEKEIEFIRNLEATDVEVWFSPSKLERIMYNLLSNAFKYTQAGDYVKLSARLDTKDNRTLAIISVKDSGRGIPEEMQEKIFESYFQVEKQDHRNGFGLGLSLTRSLVHLHKGTIKVVSEPGKGSEFIVTLDVSQDAYTDDEKLVESITPEEIRRYNQRMKDTLELIPDKDTGESPGSGGRECILLVEDNREMNEYLYSIFSEKYDVLRAYNGEEALKILSRRLPDIIVTDIMMPRMDGIEFTRAVKADMSTSHIPVILLTAKTDEADYTEGYGAGAEAYITKPFSTQNLELLILNIQKNRQRNIERFKKAEEMNVKQIVNNPRDEKFMKELVDLIMKNMANEEFSVSDITSSMHISRSLLHTKLKSLTGCSITQFLRTIRMKEAKTRLMEGMNVSEASYAVGMSDPNYFTKCFRKEFNITPTEFIRQISSGQ